MKRSLVAMAVLLSAVACQPALKHPATSSQASPSPPVAQATASPTPAVPPAAIDLTWISDEAGWALASDASVYATTDGGQHWSWQMTLVHGLPGFPHIRFADRSHGYVFGPDLLVTTDGGQVWLPAGGPPVEDLEPAGGLVYRLIYDHGGCPGPCNRILQVGVPGTSSWRQLRAFSQVDTGDAPGAQVIPSGRDLYIPLYRNRAGGGDGHSTLFRSPDGGASWQRFSDPCGSYGQAEIDAAAFAAAPGGFLAVLCVPRTLEIPDFVITSGDAGSRWSSRRWLASEMVSLIAAGSSAHLAVASPGSVGSGEISYEMLSSVDGGATWTKTQETATLSEGVPQLAFLGYEDPQTARWMADDQSIWTTADGGRSWSRHAFP